MPNKFKLFKPSDIGLASLAITFVLSSGLVEPKLFSNNDEPRSDTTSDYKKEFCRAKNAEIRESLKQSSNLHLDDGTPKNTDNPKIFLEISYGGTPSEIKDMSLEENPVCWTADTYFFEYTATDDHHCITEQQGLDELLNLFNLPAQFQVIESSGSIHSLVTASDRAGLDICTSTKTITPLQRNDL